MKTLLLLRHAKSSWKHAELADHERPLNKRGKAEAPRVGRWLRDRDGVPDLIITSTAKRARKTAEKVAETCGYADDLQLTERLYDADLEDFLDVLRAVPEPRARVLLVSHNPGVEECLEHLTGSDELMPPAALAEITLPITRWSQLTMTTKGLLVNLWHPQDEA